MQLDLFMVIKPDKKWLSNMSPDTIFAYYKNYRILKIICIGQVTFRYYLVAVYDVLDLSFFIAKPQIPQETMRKSWPST